MRQKEAKHFYWKRHWRDSYEEAVTSEILMAIHDVLEERTASVFRISVYAEHKPKSLWTCTRLHGLSSQKAVRLLMTYV
jgi:hypothetical protein